jgi:DNA-directed RNA polymerase subunit beta
MVSFEPDEHTINSNLEKPIMNKYHNLKPIVRKGDRVIPGQVLSKVMLLKMVS